MQSESISRRTLLLATGGTVAFLLVVGVGVLLITPGSDAGPSPKQPIAQVAPATSTTLSATDFAGDQFGAVPRAKTTKAQDEAPITLLARMLGIPKDEVRKAIAQHRALAPLSTKPGVTAQGLIDALMVRPKRVLRLQVASGALTQDAANLHLIQYLRRFSLMVYGTLPKQTAPGTATTVPAGDGTKTTTTTGGGSSGIQLKPGTKIPGLKLPPGTKIPGLKLPPGTKLPPGSITLK